MQFNDIEKSKSDYEKLSGIKIRDYCRGQQQIINRLHKIFLQILTRVGLRSGI